MFKNVQIKIVLLFFLIGFILIAGLGTYFHFQLVAIQEQMVQNQISVMHPFIVGQMSQINFVMMIILVVFGLSCILIGAFLSKTIISPVNRLIENAEKIAKGERVNLKPIEEGKKPDEADELVSAFGNMTTELKESLNEMIRQKNQIETILLHMTDGIVAFNREGKVILINPAATRALEILPSDNTFDTIFGKLNLSINMEKIIYLENWTSSEQRVQIKEKYINLFFAPFKDENDRPAGVMVVVQDITEHVKLDNMRKEFVADVSHGIKNTNYFYYGICRYLNGK